MKKILVVLTALSVLACKKTSEPAKLQTNPIAQPTTPSSKILMLKVDYLTYNFEGGKEINLSQSMLTNDSIPIKIDYKSPGDFGNITLYYKPTNDKLFDGSIIWMGKGNMTFPAQLDSASTFVKINNATTQPLSSRFQLIFNQNQTPNISSIWNAIQKLKIISNYLPNNKKIGVFLYTPSVGIGDPADWDWFIFMSN